MAGEPAAVVDWSVAGAALEGGRSGDAHVVAAFAQGALVAAIDGLGHGPEAADAADAAARILAAHAGEPVPDLIARCHDGLRKTRGAVLSVAAFDAKLGAMTWAAIGNVEGFLLRASGSSKAREAIPQRGGVVGYQMPAVRAVVVPVGPGDTLVLATDGIRSGFLDAVALPASPRALAQSILERHRRGNDDALVLVARYLGAPP